MSRNSNYKQKKTIKNSVYNPTQSSACHGVAFGRRRVLSSQSSSLSTPNHFQELCSDLIQRGHSVRFRAPGHSMHPTIRSGEILVVEPIDPASVDLGDIILYRTNIDFIAHRVVRIIERDNHNSDSNSVRSLPGVASGEDGSSSPLTQSTVLIPHHSLILRGDSAATCDQPVKPDQILGKVIAIERHDRKINPYSFSYKLLCLAHKSGSRVKSFFV